MAKEYIDKIKQIYLVNPSRFYENVPTLTTKFECLIEIIDIDDKCKLQPDNFLSPGDYIRITRPDYHQYGIYIGNKKVCKFKVFSASSIAIQTTSKVSV
jgi:hypothetical protein